VAPPSSVASNERPIQLSVDPDTLLWQELEDEHFIFNPASGHTHVFNEPGARLLQALGESPRTRAQLLEVLQDPETPEDPQLLQAHLDWMLRQLDELGLIEPVP